MQRVTLYGYWRSSASWRVRTALHHKQVPFETVPVHLVRDGGEQRQAAHLARNPLGQVPVLAWHESGTERRLTQSLAILEYLEERFPEPPLLPAEPFARARVRQLAEIVNSGIQPVQNLAVLQRVTAIGGDKVRWAREAIERGLDALEALAAETAGDFLVGDAPSFADLCLVPQLYNARRFGLVVDNWPVLARVEARCAALPAFVAAHPDRQPDSEQPQE